MLPFVCSKNYVWILGGVLSLSQSCIADQNWSWVRRSDQIFAWALKKVQIKVHAWTWTWAVILSSHKLTVLNSPQWSDVSLRSKLKFKFRHELWSELFLKLTQRPDLICELKIRSDLLYNSGLIGSKSDVFKLESIW